MVHNGIEYGVMAAYAEGMALLKAANIGKKAGDGRCRDDAAARPRALSVRPRTWPTLPKSGAAAASIASWLLDLQAAALIEDPHSVEIRGPRLRFRRRAAGPIKAAIDEGVPAHVLSSALYERFSSRGEADFADKLLSAMRFEFGGHIEKPAGS